ncbi:hypothetical protein NW759_000402 [Fusarium solani]|nr:hypothetical protein NW759_000402 [Fusarium solani]
MEDCDTIRRLEINARFIKLDKDKSAKDHTHFLVVNMNDQMSKFANTLPRVTKEGLTVKRNFSLSPLSITAATPSGFVFLAGTTPRPPLLQHKPPPTPCAVLHPHPNSS